MNINPLFLLLGIAAFLLFSFLWGLPAKTRLMRKHGFDKTNDYFIALAKAGDTEAKEAVFRARVLLVIGFLGVCVIVYFMYF